LRKYPRNNLSNSKSSSVWLYNKYYNKRLYTYKPKYTDMLLKHFKDVNIDNWAVYENLLLYNKNKKFLSKYKSIWNNKF